VAVAVDDDAWNNRPTAQHRLYEFLHAWDAHWTRYENSEWPHVRSGWVNVDVNTVVNGITPRLVRLSHNGTTDVVHERTWLDSVVGAFVDPDRFPTHGMPVLGPVPAPDATNTLVTESINAATSNISTNQAVTEAVNRRVGIVEPRLSLTPLISQIERMQTE
jgi:hypothetical protein